MVINDQRTEIVVDAVPETARVLEGIVDDDCRRATAALSDVAIGVTVELLDRGERRRRRQRLVESLNGRDLGAVAGGDVLDGVESLLDGIASAPLDPSTAARVVISVLGAGGWKSSVILVYACTSTRRICLTAMEINNHVKTCAVCPADSLVKVTELALDVGIAWLWIKCPVADGNADVIQASTGHGSDVALSDPRGPVRRQCRLRCRLTERLAEGPFVDRTVTGGLEERRGDPRLEDKPPAQIDAPDLLVVVVETGCSVCQAT